MACLSGKVIHVQLPALSQGGKQYQSGVLELGNGDVQDFVLFGAHDAPLEVGDFVQLTGNTKGGTFMSEWRRKKVTTIFEAKERPIIKHKRGDEIDGKPPIEWLMDNLGPKEVTRRLRAEFSTFSEMFKSKANREKYQALLCKWIIERQEKDFGQTPSAF